MYMHIYTHTFIYAYLRTFKEDKGPQERRGPSRKMAQSISLKLFASLRMWTQQYCTGNLQRNLLCAPFMGTLNVPGVRCVVVV